LKLKYDELLSNFGFNCNMRQYIEDALDVFDAEDAKLAAELQKQQKVAKQNNTKAGPALPSLSTFSTQLSAAVALSVCTCNHSSYPLTLVHFLNST